MCEAFRMTPDTQRAQSLAVPRQPSLLTGNGASGIRDVTP